MLFSLIEISPKFYALHYYDVIIFFMLIPLMLIFVFMKLMPKCRDFKKNVASEQRLILYIIVVGHAIRLILQAIDVFSLSDLQQELGDVIKRSKYCLTSGGTQIFIYQFCCMLTAWYTYLLKN